MRRTHHDWRLWVAAGSGALPADLVARLPRSGVSVAMPMRPELQIRDTLQMLAPDGMCDGCIADRVPLSFRPPLKQLIDHLQPPQFERATGECIACQQVSEVIRHAR